MNLNGWATCSPSPTQRRGEDDYKAVIVNWDILSTNIITKV